MSTKAEIKKIVLDLGGVEVSITPEQAKKLHEVLDNMYGTKTVVYPYQPPVVIRDNRWWWDKPQPMWSGTGGMPDVMYSSDTKTMSMSVSTT